MMLQCCRNGVVFFVIQTRSSRAEVLVSWCVCAAGEAAPELL